MRRGRRLRWHGSDVDRTDRLGVRIPPDGSTQLSPRECPVPETPDPSAIPPIVTVDPDAAGQAPILSYNVPDSTSYAGRNLIRLPFDADDDPFVLAAPEPISAIPGEEA